MVSFVNGNPDHIIYPTDYLGNSCGKIKCPANESSCEVGADLKYAFFPRLDQDINSQLPTILSGSWWKFKPYTLVSLRFFYPTQRALRL